MAFLKAIRPINLLMIAFVQFMLYQFLLRPLLHFMELEASLNPMQFGSLIFATLCIAAGGYIINDIYDQEIDAINKPGSNQIGKLISRKAAFTQYYILTSIGIVIGVYLAIVLRNQYLSLFNVACATLLWIYAVYLKRTPVIGNIVVATLTAASLLIILFFEPHAHDNDVLQNIIAGYALFAFLLNLIREIIKDMQDAEGDRIGGANTFAVLAPLWVSKSLASLLIVALVGVLSYLQYLQISSNEVALFMYVTFALQIPLLLLLVLTWLAKTPTHYKNLGNLAKIIMLLGIISIYLFYKLFINS